jgi:GT2 family glycosyltransferase
VFYVDSDILIDDSFPEDLYVPRDSFYQGEVEGIIATFGCCIFLKEQFQKVNGFNETLVGYGYEDADFYRRLQLAGYKRMPIVRGLSHIDHSDDLRGSQFDDKDIIRTALRNRVRAMGHTWGPSDKQESFEVRVTTNADQRVILL